MPYLDYVSLIFVHHNGPERFLNKYLINNKKYQKLPPNSALLAPHSIISWLNKKSKKKKRSNWNLAIYNVSGTILEVAYVLITESLLNSLGKILILCTWYKWENEPSRLSNFSKVTQPAVTGGFKPRASWLVGLCFHICVHKSVIVCVWKSQSSTGQPSE